MYTLIAAALVAVASLEAAPAAQITFTAPPAWKSRPASSSMRVVEWVVPKGGGVTTLRGIDAVLGWYEAGGATEEGTREAAESLDVSEERGELEDYGDGRVGSLNRLTYTRKESGDVAEVTTARLVYTVRDGKIVRYELEDIGERET